MEENIKENKIKLTGNNLKIIAMITMLTDHIGAIFFVNNKIIYKICRTIGRLAFPIYCFLLVEGFTYTKNKKKYLFRLFIFALISEIPFNLAFVNKIFYFNYQNVFFTLFLGLFNILLIKLLNDYVEKVDIYYKKMTKIVIDIFLIFIICVISWILKTDYSYKGILLINMFYLLKNTKIIKYSLSYSLLILMSKARGLIYCIDIILFEFYSGEKGKNINKYLFYAFYPLHLIILYMIKIMIK